MKLFRKIILSIFLCLSIFLGACGKTPPPTNPNPETEQQGGSSQQGGESQSGGSQSGGGASNSGSGAGDTQTGGNNQGNGDGNQDGDSQTGGESVVNPEQVAYTILHNLAKKDIYSIYDKVEINISDSAHMGSFYNISETTLTQEEWDNALNNVPESQMSRPFAYIEEYIGTPIIGLDYTNHTGYKYTKGLNNDSYLAESTQIYNNQLIKFGGGIHYAEATDENNINSYKYDFTTRDKIPNVFATIGSTENLADLSTNLETVVTGIYLAYQNNTAEPAELQILTDINILEAEIYELKITALYDTRFIQTNKKGYVFAQYTFTFNDDNLLAFNVKNGTSSIQFSVDKDFLRTAFRNTGLQKSVNEAFPSSCDVYSYAYDFSEINVVFNEFDENKFVNDFSNYDLSLFNNN